MIAHKHQSTVDRQPGRQLNVLPAGDSRYERSRPAVGIGLAFSSALLLLVTMAAADTSLAAKHSTRDPFAGEGWRFVKERDGIRLFDRPVPGSAYPQVKASVLFRAPPARVYAVISDYDVFADFIPYVLESRTLDRRKDTRWVYQRLRLPGPISDRRYIIRSQDDIQRGPGGSYRVAWRLARSGRYPVPDAPGVIPLVMSGSWDLLAARGGSGTVATYALELDPGGLLPAWLVSLAIRDYLPQVVAAVRARVDPEFQSQSESGNKAAE